MSEYLETKRLILRNFHEDDFPAVLAWRNNPVCAKYQRWEDTSAEALRGYLTRHREDVFLSEKEEQHYAIAAFSGQALGELCYFYNPNDRCITLGITISPNHQRQGLAFELLSAVLEAIGKTYPELDIVALIHPKNTASIHLFEKLGFEQECFAESIESYVYTIFAANRPIGT